MSALEEFSYLNVLPNPLDDHQEKVCFTQKNTVVAAGAGSGKTEVLAKRFAWLVISCGIKVQEILTLTFTDKAAAEMYQRIYGTLKTLHEEESLPEDVRDRAGQALADFSLARIQTLDSYNASVLRQCANRYGITPAFSVASSDGIRNIKDSALKFMIKHSDSDILSSYTAPGKIQDFAENVLAAAIINYTSIASPDGFFTQKLEVQAQTVAAAFNCLVIGKKIDELEIAESSSVRDALREYNTLGDYCTACRDALETALETKKDAEKKNADFIGEMNTFIGMAEDFKDLDPLTASDITEGSERLSQYTRMFGELMAQAERCTGMTGKITSVSTLLKKTGDFHTVFADTVYSIFEFCDQFKTAKKMMALFDEFLSEVNRDKRQSGNLSFNDVSTMALKALVENEDIRNQEKRAYRKIMIDEFQDNNGMNRDLLYLLSLKDGEFESEDGSCVIEYDGSDLESLHRMIRDRRNDDRLFFVGDEKQSIYMFRKADVSVFRQLENENESMSITYNYRSTPELLKVFNMLFGDYRIFDPDRKSEKYEAQYSKPAQKNGMSELPTLTAQTVPMHVYMIDEDRLDQDVHFLPAADQKAYYLAKKIRETVEREKCPYSAITILDRRRNDRKTIQKYLALFSIPYEVDKYTDIFESGLISDFYYFLKLCVYPSDSQAFASYLCSPFAGMSQEAAEIILAHLTEMDDAPFNPCDSSHDAQIREDIGEGEWGKFQGARKFYAEYRPAVLRQKICRTVSDLYHGRAYKYETCLSEETSLYEEQFDLLFELARNTDESGKSLGWFLDEMTTLKKDSFFEKGDLDPSEITYPLERRDSVKIMTIHKSKGLQREHVFIWGCTGVSPRSKSSGMFFQEDTGLSLKTLDTKTDFFFRVQKSLHEKQELAEFRRLLYVALTRAKLSVHVVGQWKGDLKADNEFAILEKIIMQLYPDCRSDENQFRTLYAEGAPFDCTDIEPVKYSDLTAAESLDSIRGRTLKSLPELTLPEKEHLYTLNAVPRKDPSHMHGPDKGTLRAEEGVDLYGELSGLLARYSEQGDADEYDEENGNGTALADEEALGASCFKATDFGTLVHEYLRMMAAGIEIESYRPDLKLLKNLNDDDAGTVKSTCIRMCRQFQKSSIYAEFLDAKKHGRFCRSEYAFSMYDGEALYHGSIDLIYQKAGGELVIVDYKTDRSIVPERHRLQQECYRKAAASMIPDAGKISCCLYYLRFDRIIML